MCVLQELWLNEDINLAKSFTIVFPYVRPLFIVIYWHTRSVIMMLAATWDFWITGRGRRIVVWDNLRRCLSIRSASGYCVLLKMSWPFITKPENIGCLDVRKSGCVDCRALQDGFGAGYANGRLPGLQALL